MNPIHARLRTQSRARIQSILTFNGARFTWQLSLIDFRVYIRTIYCYNGELWEFKSPGFYRAFNALVERHVCLFAEKLDDTINSPRIFSMI